MLAEKTVNDITTILKEERPWRSLIKYLKTLDNRTSKDFADILGLSKEVFNNKLHRNSFKHAEITKLLNAYGYRITVEAKKMITIEIFWNDLTEAKKAEIREVLGLAEDDDNNWTYIPMTVMEIEKDI